MVERASKSVMLHVPRCAAALPQPLPRPTAAACGRPHLPSAHADLCPPPPITIAGVAAKVPSAPETWAPGYGENRSGTHGAQPAARVVHRPGLSTRHSLALRPAFFRPERLSPEPFPQLMSTACALLLISADRNASSAADQYLLQLRLLQRLLTRRRSSRQVWRAQGAASRTQLTAHAALVNLSHRRFRRRRRCRAENEHLSGSTSQGQRALERQ